MPRQAMRQMYLWKKRKKVPVARARFLQECSTQNFLLSRIGWYGKQLFHWADSSRESWVNGILNSTFIWVIHERAHPFSHCPIFFRHRSESDDNPRRLSRRVSRYLLNLTPSSHRQLPRIDYASSSTLFFIHVIIRGSRKAHPWA